MVLDTHRLRQVAQGAPLPRRKPSESRAHRPWTMGGPHPEEGEGGPSAPVVVAPGHTWEGEKTHRKGEEAQGGRLPGHREGSAPAAWTRGVGGEGRATREQAAGETGLPQMHPDGLGWAVEVSISGRARTGQTLMLNARTRRRCGRPQKAQ